MGRNKRIQKHAWANVDSSMNVAEIVENEDWQWEDRVVTCILKNVMSLETEHRENELLAELELHDWDIVFLNETWRADVEEKWETQSSHLFLGSGGTKGQRGVAVLLHKKVKRGFQSFHRVSERLCRVDINIGRRHLTFICVYMHHMEYHDEEVEDHTKP